MGIKDFGYAGLTPCGRTAESTNGTRFAVDRQSSVSLNEFDPAPRDLEGANLLITKVLEQSSDLERAAVQLNNIIAREPTNLNAHICLTAVLLSLGRDLEARGVLELGIRARPYTVSGSDTDCPAVLLLKGFENGRVKKIRVNQRRKISRNGGNFNARYLLDRDRVKIITFFVAHGNLLTTTDLPKFDIIVNSIADADRERNALFTAEEFISRHPDVPVINLPRRVLDTTRDATYARLGDIDGIVVPRIERVDLQDADEIHEQVERIRSAGHALPLLVRMPGHHTGRTLERVDEWKALGDYIGRYRPAQMYVTDYVECPAPVPTGADSSHQWYRRMRLFSINGRLMPATCHFSDHWNVHSHNRDTCMLYNHWMVEEEKAFLRYARHYIGAAAYRGLEQLAERVGLDFFGIDFTLQPDGTALIYEVNAQMRHSFDYVDRYPHLRVPLERISEAFQQMIIDRAGTPGWPAPANESSCRVRG